MKNAMMIGLAVGMVAGACLVSSNKKARQVVCNARDQIKSKLCPQQDEEQSGGQNGESNY